MREPEKPFSTFALDLGTDHPAYQVVPDCLPRPCRPYAWYVRVPDLPDFLRHIAPALERRLEQSALAGHTGELCISFYREGLCLALERGRLDESGALGHRTLEPGHGVLSRSDLPAASHGLSVAGRAGIRLCRLPGGGRRGGGTADGPLPPAAVQRLGRLMMASGSRKAPGELISPLLRSMLETRYHLGSISSAKVLEGGYWNRVLRVESEEDPFVLRISHPATPAGGVAYGSMCLSLGHGSHTSRNCRRPSRRWMDRHIFCGKTVWSRSFPSCRAVSPTASARLYAQMRPACWRLSIRWRSTTRIARRDRAIRPCATWTGTRTASGAGRRSAPS